MDLKRIRVGVLACLLSGILSACFNVTLLSEGGIGGTGQVADGGGTSPSTSGSPTIDGGGISHFVDNGGIGGSGISMGPITGFGSVYVNGIHYNIDDAQIFVEGQPAFEDALHVGMVVAVTGEFNETKHTGTASRIDFSYTLKGMVVSASQVNGYFKLGGVRVDVDELTIFDGVQFSGLRAGDLVSVSTIPGPQGGFLARYVIKTGVQVMESGGGTVGSQNNGGSTGTGGWSTGGVWGNSGNTGTPPAEPIVVDGVCLEGGIENFNADLTRFVIGGQTVNYGSAQYVGMTADELVQGLRVRVTGSYTTGIVYAETIEPVVTPQLSNSDETITLAGYPSAWSANDDHHFVMGDYDVLVTDDTQYLNGGFADLTLDSGITVTGHQDENGYVVAGTITFESGDKVGLNATIDSIQDNILILAGFKTQVTTATMMIDSGTLHLRRFSVADLNVGDAVKLYGYQVGDTIGLSRLERVDQLSDNELQGPVQSIDGNTGFTVAGISVDTSALDQWHYYSRYNTPVGPTTFYNSLIVGGRVKVNGSFNGAAFQVTRVQLQ